MCHIDTLPFDLLPPAWSAPHQKRKANLCGLSFVAAHAEAPLYRYQFAVAVISKRPGCKVATKTPRHRDSLATASFP
jgi:hypothetical protein